MDLRKPPRTVLGLTWREHIGGRWAVSWLGFLLLLPILVISPLANLQDATFRNVGLWLIASLVTLAPLIFIWWVSAVTVLRNRTQHPVHIWVVVAIGFISGAMRSGAMTWVTVTFDLFTPQVSVAELLVVRMLIGGFQGAVGMPVLAMLLSVVSRYRTERARLLHQAVTLEQQRDQELGAVNALRSALTGPVRMRLQELADRLGSDATSIDAVAGDVRAQAHLMWSEANADTKPPRVRIVEVLRAAVRNRPLPVVAIWFIWLPSAFLTFILRGTPGLAVVQLFVGTAVLSTIYLTGTALAHRAPRLGLPIFLIGTVGGALASGYAVWLLSGAPSWDTDLVLYVTSVPWLMAITLIVSVVESAVIRSEQVLHEIRSGIREGEIELHRQQRARSELAYEVASVLHGVVQGRLAVAQRSTSDGTALARRALDEGVERLRQAPTATALPAADVVNDVVAPWTALMSVSVNVAAGDLPAHRVRDVSDVLEESLSNAFRHGSATEVAIKVQLVDEGWLVEIYDNGSGAPGSVEVGLGSSLFDAVSGGEWSRSPGSNGGCVVTVRIGV